DCKGGAAVTRWAANIPPALTDERLVLGRRVKPVFQLIADRYLDARYSAEAAAKTCGIPADTIRRIAAELAHIAFDEPIEIAVPWTDWAGRRHETMRGRP